MAGRQGFASMDPDKQRRIARMGGKKSGQSRARRLPRGNDE
jgi:general stress protein YciG